MSERRRSVSSHANVPRLIVANNLDFPVRYAGWFGTRGFKAARTAAKTAQFHTIIVDTPRLEELGARLEQGTVENGQLQLSLIDETLTREIDELILLQQATMVASEVSHTTIVEGNASSQEFALDQPVSNIWDTLKPGMLVLAADLDRRGTPDAWYEAEIVSADGLEVHLRWRDFPRDGVIRRTRRHVAILHPVF